MGNWTIPFIVDLAKGAPFIQQTAQGLMLPYDHEAHTILVTVLDNGEPAALSGTPMGYFRRKDGLTVRCEGTVDGNVIRVTMDAACYLPGPLRCVIRLLSDVENDLGMSLVDAQLNVREGTGDQFVDPGDVFPTVQEQARQIAALQTSLEAVGSRVTDLESAPVLEEELTLESAWQTWTTTPTETLRVMRIGGIVFLQGIISNKSAMTLSSNTKVCDLPSWAYPARLADILNQGGAHGTFLIVARPYDATEGTGGYIDVSRYNVGGTNTEMSANTMLCMTGCWLAADAAGEVVDDLEVLVARMEATLAASVRYDLAQSLTAAQQQRARENIGASGQIQEDTSGLIINL